jgi:hypothetical protein
MRSGISKTFMGNTALMSSLSCDSVIAGAFFPQPDSHVPEEKMSRHACQHMVSPAGKLPHLVVIHPQIRFGLLKALLDGPAKPREPNEGFQAGGSVCVRDEIGISGAFSKSPANNQPNRPVGLSVFTQNNPTLHKLVGHRSLRSLGDHPAIPEVVVHSPGDLRESDRFLLGFRKDVFRPLLPTVPVGLIQDRRFLEPVKGVTGKSNRQTERETL